MFKVAPQPNLNSAEWSVVSLALREAERRGCSAPPAPGSLRAKLERVWTIVTGIELPHRLADPRLEQLRRFVLATRKTRRIAEQFVPALLSQGYNRAELDAIALLAA
jgi:hypothetical protein